MSLDINPELIKSATRVAQDGASAATEMVGVSIKRLAWHGFTERSIPPLPRHRKFM